MKTTIDSAGRLVIPQPIRKEAGLQAGSDLEVRFVDGRIEIEPTTLPVRLEKRGRFLRAVPSGPAATLGAEVVERTRRKLEEERTGPVITARRRGK